MQEVNLSHTVLLIMEIFSPTKSVAHFFVKHDLTMLDIHLMGSNTSRYLAVLQSLSCWTLWLPDYLELSAQL